MICNLSPFCAKIEEVFFKKWGIFMLDKYLAQGKIDYFKNISRSGNISIDMFKVEYNNKIHYLVCTFDGFQIIKIMLVS